MGKKWTLEEEEALNDGVKKHGLGKWKQILEDPDFAHTLRGRSNVQVKARWTKLLHTGEAAAKDSPTGAAQGTASAVAEDSLTGATQGTSAVAQDSPTSTVAHNSPTGAAQGIASAVAHNSSTGAGQGTARAVAENSPTAQTTATQIFVCRTCGRPSLVRKHRTVQHEARKTNCTACSMQFDTPRL